MNASSSSRAIWKINSLLEYWLIRDESPETRNIIRRLGWDGETPNPYCFNCLHTLARHYSAHRTPIPSALRLNGGDAECDKEGCDCTHYDPSFIEDVL